jgi:hypothetical protein
VGPAWGRLTAATAGANLLAGVLLAAAFASVRNQAALDRQVGGLELAALAATVAIVADLAHIVATYRAVVAGRRRLSGLAVSTTGADPSIRATFPHPVALPRGTLVHHPACALVGGKNAAALSPEVIAAKGLRPCPVCSP